MGIFLAVVGALSALVLVALLVALGKRLSDLARALTSLQTELVPILETIRAASDETQRLAKGLEERARALRPNDG